MLWQQKHLVLVIIKRNASDIATLTNAKFYNKELNMKLEDMKLEELGTIKSNCN